MKATPSSTLIIQPYGGTIVAPTAKVYFLNDTATDVALAILDGCTAAQAAERIASTYQISASEAETDVETFLQHSDVAPLLRSASEHNWDVFGSDENTSIVEADICLTNRCNLECTYCYAESRKTGNGDLTPDQWVTAVRTLVRLGMRKATVAGGEPTLSRALFPVLGALSDKRVATQLFTNGLLVKDEIAERLADIPLNFVQVSLDSTNEEHHNRYRGPSHALALRAINLLVRFGVPVVIGANIFPDTLDEIARLAQLADSIGAKLRCNPIEARGRATSFDTRETVVNEFLASAVARGVEEASERFSNVFAEQDVRRTLETSERVCPFAKGCIAVNASAEIRPCSQADTFFQSIAPWVVTEHPKPATAEHFKTGHRGEQWG